MINKDFVLFKEFEIIFHGKKTTGFEYESLATFSTIVLSGRGLVGPG